MISPKNIAIIKVKESEEADKTYKELIKKYNFFSLNQTDSTLPDDIEIVVTLGGDGFMLHTLHQFINKNVSFFGMNCGTIGFLMNECGIDKLIERIENARTTNIHPLKMVSDTVDGEKFSNLAINEVSLLRRTAQASHIKISLDEKTHMEEMVCDGVLVATPAGSSAYNFSIGGPIVPLKAELLALTPISPFRPRRWHGALLPNNVNIRFDILDFEKRPVNAVADFTQVRNVKSVQVTTEKEITVKILFDPGHSLEERIVKEQFAY